jgi:hypothetical protein
MVDFVLDQFSEIGWKPNPMPAAPFLILIADGDTSATLHADDAIGDAQAIVPDFEFFPASPGNFRVDQGERSSAKIHYDESLANADLWRSHGASETAALAELGKRGVKTSELPGEIRIRPTDFGRLLLEARIADRQDWKGLGNHTLFWPCFTLLVEREEAIRQT